MTRSVRFWIFYLIAPPLIVGCSAVKLSPPAVTNIYLSEPMMAKAADEDSIPINSTTVFKTTDKRIYATICVQGPEHVRLGARWYYSDKLITDQAILVPSQQCGARYLESPPGGTFLAGEYRIEIYLVRSADKIVRFTVTGDAQ